MPLQQRWTVGRVWLITPVLKTGEGNTSGGSNPSLSAISCSLIRKIPRSGTEEMQLCYPPAPTEPKLNREDDVHMIGEYNRDVSKRKALRKRRLADRIYIGWHEDDDWQYYDNLHQYSKNKIHCSCPACQTKTRNKGHRRYRKGGYHRAINYKRQDLVRMIEMDQDIEETLGTKSHRRVKEWI